MSFSASGSATTAVAEMTYAEAAAAAGGTLRGATGAITGYSIDSRTLQDGDLFFALVGPNHDGHDFLKAAFAAGAAGVVVDREVEAPEGKAVLRVEDTTVALQGMASHARQRESLKVVGITGSAGKTTAKEMTHELLSGAVPSFRSAGNLNNLYGLPLSLLRKPAGSHVAVLEMGMSYPGEMRRLAEIARPDVGVLLNVGRAHQKNFVSPQAIALAKAELFEVMGSHGTGIFNADDDLVRRVADQFSGFTFTFGIDRTADLMAEDVRAEGFEGMSLRVKHGGKSLPCRIGFVGVHHVYNLLAALAAGYMLGCDIQGMLQRVEALTPVAGRGNRIELPDGTRLIDDTYNSNPAALRRATAALAAAAPWGSRRVLVTGDMLELGDHAEEAHREAGRVAGEARLELVIAVGPLSAETAHAAREAGAGEVLHCADSEAAAAALVTLLQAGDTVLVKGSRGMHMEHVVQTLQRKGAAASSARGS